MKIYIENEIIKHFIIKVFLDMKAPYREVYKIVGAKEIIKEMRKKQVLSIRKDSLWFYFYLITKFNNKKYKDLIFNHIFLISSNGNNKLKYIYNKYFSAYSYKELSNYPFLINGTIRLYHKSTVFRLFAKERIKQNTIKKEIYFNFTYMYIKEFQTLEEKEKTKYYKHNMELYRHIYIASYIALTNDKDITFKKFINYYILTSQDNNSIKNTMKIYSDTIDHYDLFYRLLELKYIRVFFKIKVPVKNDIWNRYKYYDVDQINKFYKYNFHLLFNEMKELIKLGLDLNLLYFYIKNMSLDLKAIGGTYETNKKNIQR